MKKLAILLTGQFRTWEGTKQSFLKNIIEVNKDKYDIDIFVYTWNSLGYSSVGIEVKDEELTSLDKKLIEKYGCSKAPRPSPLLDINLLKKEINPVKIIVEDDKNMDELVYNVVNTNTKTRDIFYPNTYVNYLNVYNCTKLKNEYETEKNFIYDVVVRVRPDILYKEPIIFSDIKEKTIYMHNHYVNDLIFYGTSQTMNETSNIIKSIDPTKHMDPHRMFNEFIIANCNKIETKNLNISLLRQNEIIWNY